MQVGQFIRQGDIYVLRVASIPKTAKPTDANKRVDQATQRPAIVLATGEATGHAHVVTGDWVQELQDETNARYLDVKDREAPVTHEEHTAHVLAPGEHLTWQQVEYTPTEIRRVSD